MQFTTRRVAFSLMVLVVTLVAARTIAGQVLQPPGNPVTGIPIDAYCPYHELGSVVCCMEGVFGDPDAMCTTVLSVEACDALDGAVQNCLPPQFNTVPPGAVANFTQMNTSANKTFVRQLLAAVAASGIPDRVYNETTYDCDKFATDMEQYLQAQGYAATFTLMFTYNATNHYEVGHALTDVHLPNGEIIFVEPQTGEIVNMDIDGDGKVEAEDHPASFPYGYHPTDDNVQIAIYESAAEAVAAGVVMD